jgi:hypothetical protein
MQQHEHDVIHVERIANEVSAAKEHDPLRTALGLCLFLRYCPAMTMILRAVRLHFACWNWRSGLILIFRSRCDGIEH